MSISGHSPFYLVVFNRPDGMIDYELFDPRGWSKDKLVYRSVVAARDIEQALGRIQDRVPPRQKDIEIFYNDYSEARK